MGSSRRSGSAETADAAVAQIPQLGGEDISGNLKYTQLKNPWPPADKLFKRLSIIKVADGGLGIGPPTNEESAPSTCTTNTTSSSKHSHATGHNLTAHNSQGYCDISVPVYATVKGANRSNRMTLRRHNNSNNSN